MLVRLTKSHYTAQLVLAILLALALWIPNFFADAPAKVTEPSTFLYSLLFGWTKTHTILAKIIAFVCVILQAFMLTELVRAHSLSKNSMFAGLVYIILVGSQGDFQTLHPFVISNFFIIGGLAYLLKIYGRKEPYEYVLNASLMFALASLFSALLLPFGLVVFFVLLFYSISSWREWVIAIIGFGFPFLVLYLWAAMTENLGVFADFLIPIGGTGSLQIVTEIPIQNQIFLAVAVLLSLAGFTHLSFQSKYNDISQRKKVAAVSVSGLWITLLALFTSYQPLVHLPTLSVFCAFFISERLFRTKREWLSELMLYAFLIVAFLMRYL